MAKRPPVQPKETINANIRTHTFVYTNIQLVFLGVRLQFIK